MSMLRAYDAVKGTVTADAELKRRVAVLEKKVKNLTVIVHQLQKKPPPKDDDEEDVQCRVS